MNLPVFIVVAALTGVLHQTTGQQTGGNPCEQQLQNCITPLDSAVVASARDYNYTAVCRNLESSAGCYDTAYASLSCSGYQDRIRTLNASTASKFANLCPNGQPDSCLLNLKSCVDDYRRASSSTNAATLCPATLTATQCLNSLQCPPLLQAVLSQFEGEIAAGVASAHCNTSSNLSPCGRDVMNCLTPIVNRLKTMEKNYDFDGMCSSWPQAQACSTRFQSDPNCASERANITAKMTTFNQRFHQYCDDNNQPKACLKVLMNCTRDYTTILGMPLFKSDPLYACQGLEGLVECMGQVNADLNTCEALKTVSVFANFKSLQLQFNHSCSSVLTVCTKPVAQGIVSLDLKMQDAQEFGQYDKMCKLAGDFNKLLVNNNNQVNCSQNPFLGAEQTYISNITNTLCQSTDATQAKPCLKQVQSCTQAFYNTEQQNILNICSGQATLAQCLGGINCPDSTLEAQLNRAKQKTVSDECTSNSAVTQTVSFMLLLLSALRLWA